MSYLLKDNHATVIHIDDDVIRASIGLGDLFNRPTIVSSFTGNVARLIDRLYARAMVCHEQARATVVPIRAMRRAGWSERYSQTSSVSRVGKTTSS